MIDLFSPFLNLIAWQKNKPVVSTNTPKRILIKYPIVYFVKIQVPILRKIVHLMHL